MSDDLSDLERDTLDSLDHLARRWHKHTSAFLNTLLDGDDAFRDASERGLTVIDAALDFVQAFSNNDPRVVEPLRRFKQDVHDNVAASLDPTHAAVSARMRPILVNGDNHG